MNFFTPVEIEKPSFSIDYNSKIVFIGSCFAENISLYFENAKFQSLKNPAGILYNPLSINTMIENIWNKKHYTEKDFFFDGTQYNSYDFHSRFSSSDLYQTLENVNNSFEKAYNFFCSANVFFITLGSAYVYFLKETLLPVANCHKQKSEKFFRRLISVDEVKNALINIVETIQKFNNQARIVFTVSPLRHFRDGAHNNNLSKSTLELGINEIIEKYENVSYFPSFEIVIDELRDYRFYASDMIHLSEVSEQYIWQKIQQTYFSSNVILQVEKVEKFMKSANHRVQNAFSEASKAFAKKNFLLAEALESEIQGLKLDKEKEYFSRFC